MRRSPVLSPTVCCLATALALAMPGGPARAQIAANSGSTLPAAALDSDRGLHVDLAWDVAITAGAFATWLTLELLTPTLVDDCRWCDRDTEGNDVLNAFDAGARDALRWDNTHSADTWSTVFSFALAPALGVGVGVLVTAHDDRLDELPEGLLIVSESAMLAMALNNIVKIAAARERPDVHARTPEEREANHQPSDNVSFYSGHTTLAFALATSAGTIASMRGYRLAPVMWATTLALASVSGYLRIAADRHYATDVLTGALIGSAIGFSVPYFFHRGRDEGWQLMAAPAAHGAELSISGIF
jgi:membrane-associated phospholipid phosphatase